MRRHNVVIFLALMLVAGTAWAAETTDRIYLPTAPEYRGDLLYRPAGRFKLPDAATDNTDIQSAKEQLAKREKDVEETKLEITILLKQLEIKVRLAENARYRLDILEAVREVNP